MADKTATLKLPDGKSLDVPVLSGTLGPEVVDIRTWDSHVAAGAR